MKNLIFLFIFSFGFGIITPQANISKNDTIPNKEEVSLEDFSEKLLQEAKQEVLEKKKHDEIVKKNKGYIYNLEKKIKEEKPKVKRKTIPKKDSLEYIEFVKEPIIYYEPIYTCVKKRSWFGLIFNNEVCKRMEKTDSIKIKIYEKL